MGISYFSWHLDVVRSGSGDGSGPGNVAATAAPAAAAGVVIIGIVAAYANVKGKKKRGGTQGNICD